MTRTTGGDASPSLPPSSLPSGGGRFVPGTLLAARYRVIALLGQGGMGEVIRADDLKLGQQVALKFLPPALARDPGALARFHREVRVARQISHPNVCRVFDIGEAEGQPFLTMEYIDGEDLASLLRRIGRLPEAKAVELARQLCAGLAAAHEVGILHRDLKPANVMIDGRGRARITDFGLAGIELEAGAAEIFAGTPAYMSPEQLAGKEVTRRSEIYSLGLLLSELFTGRRVFDAKTLPELRRQHEDRTPESPSTLVRDLDPLIDAVIARCLASDPSERPDSALQVAAALPGGDPLQAALRAGETPSPEMVAAAPTRGALSSRVALGLLVAGVLLLLAVVVGDSVSLVHRGPLDMPPEVLADRARAVLDRAREGPRPNHHLQGSTSTSSTSSTTTR
ncbi:MAG: serine/threonine-protein kinase [Candidatus Eisenbacteria bacterium]